MLSEIASKPTPANEPQSIINPYIGVIVLPMQKVVIMAEVKITKNLFMCFIFHEFGL